MKLFPTVLIILFALCVLSYLAILAAKGIIAKQNRKRPAFYNKTRSSSVVSKGYSSHFGKSDEAPSSELSKWEKSKKEQEEKDKTEKEHKSIKEKLGDAEREARRLDIERHLRLNLDDPKKRRQRQNQNLNER